jgi:hypothetical protein
MGITEICITSGREDGEAGETNRLRRELDFNYFVGFARCRLPLPLPNCIQRRLGQHGMAPPDLYRFHGAIGRNYGFDFYAALDLHIAGKAGILRRNPSHDLT